MSIQFGRWNFDGLPIDRDYIEKVNALLSPYGPDGSSEHSTLDVSIVYRAFHTTPESCTEKQPHACRSGAIITFDGRLDNRSELTRRLAHAVRACSSDVEIVAAAYEQWGKECFSKLIGDWALVIWNPEESSLLLAKDPIGVRHLYYSLDPSHAIWSTVLDPVVVLSGCRLELCREYIAGWLGLFPATHLTPYTGIQSVPPSSFVLIRPGRTEYSKYWDFDPSTNIRYPTDRAYEEHFLEVFRQSVQRRLRSERPVLAELSGGMDSSSIVSLADEILTSNAGRPRLDTVSYYDDSEPNWNERPYFTKVEEKRGRTGWHIDAGAECAFDFDGEYRLGAPDCRSGANAAAREFASCMAAGNHRVVLSGIGGDEVTGGSPNFAPELMDLLVQGQLARLAHQLKCWALEKRRPWFHLLFEAVREFLPVPRTARPASWLAESFAACHRKALAGYSSRIRFRGALPSFQQGLATIDAVRRQLTSSTLPDDPVREVRYPFLDRDLLEFLLAVPREQLVRPGERRSLLRRSMRSIVPDEILKRRRKAYVARSPLAAISREWTKVAGASWHMTAGSLGIIDEGRLRGTLDQGRRGEPIQVVTLARTLAVEFWLKAMIARGILAPASDPAAAAGEVTLKRDAAKGWERRPSSAS